MASFHCDTAGDTWTFSEIPTFCRHQTFIKPSSLLLMIVQWRLPRSSLTKVLWVNLMYCDDGIHFTRRQLTQWTLMNGWKIGAWLISKWNPPFAVVGWAGRGSPQEATILTCFSSECCSLLHGRAALEEQTLISYWKYDTASQDPLKWWVPKTVYFKFWLSTSSSWNSVINDRQHDALPP